MIICMDLMIYGIVIIQWLFFNSSKTPLELNRLSVQIAEKLKEV